MSSKFFTALAVTGIAIILSTAHLLGPDDIQAAQDVADEAEYAAALADGGVAKCAKLGRVPKWTSDGDLVCRAANEVLAEGGQP